MAMFMDAMCYEECRGPHAGSAAYHGLVALYPGLRMPQALRTLHSWETLVPGEEGLPVAAELLMCMADRLRSGGDTKRREAADIIELSFDGYLREMDWEQLRGADVQDAGPTRSGEAGVVSDAVAIMLGMQSRGEASKTGHNQGLLIDFPGVRQMLRRRKAAVEPNEHLFSLRQPEYRRLWKEIVMEMGVEGLVGKPHSVRHTGPSRDVFLGYRGLREIQRRGRWRADASVLRYAKTHYYVRCMAQTPRDLIERGAELLEALGARAVPPLGWRRLHRRPALPPRQPIWDPDVATAGAAVAARGS